MSAAPETTPAVVAPVEEVAAPAPAVEETAAPVVEAAPVAAEAAPVVEEAPAATETVRNPTLYPFRIFFTALTVTRNSLFALSGCPRRRRDCRRACH